MNIHLFIMRVIVKNEEGMDKTRLGISKLGGWVLFTKQHDKGNKAKSRHITCFDFQSVIFSLRSLLVDWYQKEKKRAVCQV